MTAEVLEQRLGEFGAKLENFDGLREAEATMGQLRLLGDKLREIEATLRQLRLLGEVVTKLENFDGMREVEAM